MNVRHGDYSRRKPIVGGDARLARGKNPARDRAAPEGVGRGRGGGQVRVHVIIVPLSNNNAIGCSEKSM